MKLPEFRRAALSGARWTLASRVALQLFTWPVTIIVMRLLSPGDYGLFALALVVSGFLSLFAELGLGVALVQADEAPPEKQRAACSLIVALNLSVALVLLAGAPLLGDAFDEPGLAPVVQLLCVDLLFGALGAVPQAMLERGLRFRELSLAQMIAGVSGSAATLLAAWFDMGVWALAAGLLTQGAVRALLLVGFHGSLVWPGRVRAAVVGQLVRFSGHVLASRVLWYWYGQSDLVLVARLVHASVLGYYSVAAQLAMLPAGKAMEAINRVAFPILSRLRTDATALADVHRRLIALLAVYGFGICWGLGSVADEFVELLLGPKWAPAAWPLACLCVVAPLRMVCSLHNTITTALGRPEAATKELALASVVMPVAVAYGAWAHGLAGAALAWPLAYPVVYLFSNHLTCRAVGVGAWTGVRCLLAPAAAGIVMQAVVWSVGLSLEAAGAGVLAMLAAEVLLGALAYLVVLWLAARTLLREAIALTLELLGRKQQAAGTAAA